mmetsp:Transcript_4673/g.7073  ORF Transcript_4673/g.7073 Transcript_4673/m.7073 type:complete len:95 (-) Transcript_4673:84-368(-)
MKNQAEHELADLDRQRAIFGTKEAKLRELLYDVVKDQVIANLNAVQKGKHTEVYEKDGLVNISESALQRPSSLGGSADNSVERAQNLSSINFTN